GGAASGRASRRRFRAISPSHHEAMKARGMEINTRRYWPLAELTLARLREFYREPEALFWVYGFPILLVVGLGIAFRNQPVERIAVDVVEGLGAEAVVTALAAQEKFVPRRVSPADARVHLRTGRTELVVTATQAAD